VLCSRSPPLCQPSLISRQSSSWCRTVVTCSSYFLSLFCLFLLVILSFQRLLISSCYAQSIKLFQSATDWSVTMKCVATLWDDRIYLFVCPQEWSACHEIECRSTRTSLSKPFWSWVWSLVSTAFSFTGWSFFSFLAWFLILITFTCRTSNFVISTNSETRLQSLLSHFQVLIQSRQIEANRR